MLYRIIAGEIASMAEQMEQPYRALAPHVYDAPSSECFELWIAAETPEVALAEYREWLPEE